MKNYELNIDGEKYEIGISAHGLRRSTLTEGFFLDELKKEPEKITGNEEGEIEKLCFSELVTSMGTVKHKRSLRDVKFNKPIEEDSINYDGENTQLWFTDSSNKVCEISDKDSGEVRESLDLRESVR